MKNELLPELQEMIDFCIENKIRFFAFYHPTSTYLEEFLDFKVKFESKNFEQEVSVKSVDQINDLLELANKFKK